MPLLPWGELDLYPDLLWASFPSADNHTVGVLLEFFGQQVLGSSSVAELEELGLDVLVGLVPHAQTFCTGNSLVYDSLPHMPNIIHWPPDNLSYNMCVWLTHMNRIPFPHPSLATPASGLRLPCSLTHVSHSSYHLQKHPNNPLKSLLKQKIKQFFRTAQRGKSRWRCCRPTGRLPVDRDSAGKRAVMAPVDCRSTELTEGNTVSFCRSTDPVDRRIQRADHKNQSTDMKGRSTARHAQPRACLDTAAGRLGCRIGRPVCLENSFLGRFLS